MKHERVKNLDEFMALGARDWHPIHRWVYRGVPDAIGVSVLEARERERSDRASGIAKEQVADPVYNRQYDLMLDTSRTTPEAGATAVRKLMNAGSRLTCMNTDPHLLRSAPALRAGYAARYAAVTEAP